MGQNRVTLGKDDLDPRLVKAGIATAHFFRASPVKVTAGERGRVLAKAVGVGNPGDGFAAIARAGKGEVVALGESLWEFWITPERNPSGGNTKLLRWLLAGGHPRRQRLARLARPLTAAEVERHWRALGDADPEAAAEALGYLAGKPALEARRRIETILKKPRTLSPEMLRAVRAVEVLENIGTPEARELLKSLAGGVPEAVLTQEAKASLERLALRPAVKP